MVNSRNSIKKSHRSTSSNVKPSRIKGNSKGVKSSSSDSGKTAPLSAYILFCLDRRSEVIQKHPEYSDSEVGRELGMMWAQLSNSKKEPYLKELRKRQKAIKQQ